MIAIKTATVLVVFVLVLWVMVSMFAYCEKHRWQDPLAQSQAGASLPRLVMRQVGGKPGQNY